MTRTKRVLGARLEKKGIGRRTSCVEEGVEMAGKKNQKEKKLRGFTTSEVEAERERRTTNQIGKKKTKWGNLGGESKTFGRISAQKTELVLRQGKRTPIGFRPMPRGGGDGRKKLRKTID